MQKFLSKFYINLILNILREKMLFTFHLTKKTIMILCFNFHLIQPLLMNIEYRWNINHINILQT